MAWGIQIREDTFSPKLIGITDRMRSQIAADFDEQGGLMEEDARRIVPVRTGYLQSTIFHQVVESDLSLTLGATADYGGFVELGTRRMGARPYLRPAFDAAQGALLDALVRGILGLFA